MRGYKFVIRDSRSGIWLGIKVIGGMSQQNDLTSICWART